MCFVLIVFVCCVLIVFSLRCFFVDGLLTFVVAGRLQATAFEHQKERVMLFYSLPNVCFCVCGLLMPFCFPSSSVANVIH